MLCVCFKIANLRIEKSNKLLQKKKKRNIEENSYQELNASYVRFKIYFP